MFGSTLALKGAIEEQQELAAQQFEHCLPGCVFCEMEALHSFEHWAMGQAAQGNPPLLWAWLL